MAAVLVTRLRYEKLPAVSFDAEVFDVTCVRDIGTKLSNFRGFIGPDSGYVEALFLEGEVVEDSERRTTIVSDGGVATVIFKDLGYFRTTLTDRESNALG